MEMNMKIVVVSMIKNEEDLIESAIRYWLSFSDNVIVYNHYSQDGTQEILDALKKEFSEELVLFSPEFEVGVEFLQEKITNCMIQRAFQLYNADLVFPLDADEFPYLIGHRYASIRDFLSSLNQDCCYYTYWVPFTCSEKVDNNTFQFVPLSYREKRTDPITMFRKYLISGKNYRSDPISISKGSHNIYRLSGNSTPQTLDISAELCYAHYMFRNLSQLRIKAAAGWIANYSDINWNGDSGHYRNLVNMIIYGKERQETVRWANLTCCGLTGENIDEVRTECIDPQEMFEPVPTLHYSGQYVKKKDEFVELLETSLALVEQYRDLRQKSICSKEEKTDKTKENQSKNTLFDWYRNTIRGGTVGKISSFISFVGDVFKDRKMLWKLSRNDFKARFASSFLGGAWSFIQPLVSLLVMWFVFQVGFKSSPVSGIPFIAWLAPAQLVWSFFSDALISGTNCLIEYSYLVKKINFRVSMLPIIKIISAMFVHAMFILVIFFILACNRVAFSIYNIQVIYYCFCTCFLLVGMCWMLGAIAPFVKDVVNVVGVFVQIGFWITPIFWSPEKMSPFVQNVLKINPMYYICRGYRDAFIDHVWFWQRGFTNVIFWLIAILFFILGAGLFHKLRPQFADVL